MHETSRHLRTHLCNKLYAKDTNSIVGELSIQQECIYAALPLQPYGADRTVSEASQSSASPCCPLASPELLSWSFLQRFA